MTSRTSNPLKTALQKPKAQPLAFISITLLCAALEIACSSSDNKKKPSSITAAPPPLSAPVPAPFPTGAIRLNEAKVVSADKRAAAVLAMSPPPEASEKYQQQDESPVKSTLREPVSTFSIDVDTGAYANIRRFLKQGQLPPKDAVRIEEMINYFPYANTTKKSGHPFGIQTEVAPAPWNADHQLLRIRVQAMDVQTSALPPANLVFLVDVSGSMDSPDKLPLVKNTLKMLTQKLRAQDRISLVVYAGRTQVELDPTPGNRHDEIIAAINRLDASGSTAGASAMRLAYSLARSAYIPGGINRILMATDGDFNVGLSDINQLKDMVAAERKTGISLTTLGFGTGNYNEYLMEQLADVGNGNYAYIDSADEGRKVLLEEMAATFNTVAADVKIQMEFNPSQIAEYRLIGYENRALKEEDFNNDKVDAGEIGAGKTVTALYELTPVGKPLLLDAHRYSSAQGVAIKTQELGFLRMRYKTPGTDTSVLLEEPVLASSAKPTLEQASPDFRFAASVAGFGLGLRDSHYLGSFDAQKIIALAKSGFGDDEGGYRAEFVRLVQLASDLQVKQPAIVP